MPPRGGKHLTDGEKQLHKAAAAPVCEGKRGLIAKPAAFPRLRCPFRPNTMGKGVPLAQILREEFAGPDGTLSVSTLRPSAWRSSGSGPGVGGSCATPQQSPCCGEGAAHGTGTGPCSPHRVCTGTQERAQENILENCARFIYWLPCPGKGQRHLSSHQASHEALCTPTQGREPSPPSLVVTPNPGVTREVSSTSTPRQRSTAREPGAPPSVAILPRFVSQS